MERSSREGVLRRCALAGAVMAALLTGCGPSSTNGDDVPGDDDGDGGGGGGGDVDAGIACREAVCFTWRADPPPASGGGGGPQEIRYDGCNPYGMRPGVCPDRFSCGGSETFTSTSFVVHTPVCSPGGAPPLVVDLDLAPPAIPDDAVEVTLTLELAGAPWPDGSATLERAGTLQVTSATDPTRTWTFDIPARGPALVAQLAPDRYDVAVSITDYEGTHYPAGYRPAELVVNAEGEDVVDFEAATATFAARLDGSPIGVLADRHSMSVSLLRAEGGATSFTFAAGQVPARTAVVRPGTYAVTLSTTSPDDSTFPVGTVALDATHVVDANETIEIPIDAPTILTSGTVTIDGADVPAAASGVVVELHGTGERPGQAVELRIGANRPARFSKRVYPGTYDVILDGGYQGWAGVPEGVALARAGWTAAPTLAVAATTVAVSGTVQRNGAPAPAGGESQVVFEGSHGRTYLGLSSDAGAAYSGRVFTGTYDVSIDGDGVRLPAAPVPVARAWTASSAAQTWRIAAHQLTVTVTHNGAVPPDLAGGSRGSLELRGDVQGQPAAASLALPATGALRATALLPDGTWSIALQNYGFVELPAGSAALGDTTLAGADRSQTFNLESIWVSGTVTADGRPLPTGPTAAARGAVSIGGALYGSGGNAWLPLPASGAATHGGWFTPGVYDVSYYCTDPACRDVGLPWWVAVHRALRLE